MVSVPGRKIRHLSAADFPGYRLYDGLRSADFQSQKLSACLLYTSTAKEKLEELNGELDLALTDGSMNPQQRQEKAAALRKEIEAFKAASKTEHARLKQAQK